MLNLKNKIFRHHLGNLASVTLSSFPARATFQSKAPEAPQQSFHDNVEARRLDEDRNGLNATTGFGDAAKTLQALADQAGSKTSMAEIRASLQMRLQEGVSFETFWENLARKGARTCHLENGDFLARDANRAPIYSDDLRPFSVELGSDPVTRERLSEGEKQKKAFKKERFALLESIYKSANLTPPTLT